MVRRVAFYDACLVTFGSSNINFNRIWFIREALLVNFGEALTSNFDSAFPHGTFVDQ